jgi:hypothetical protein
MGIQIKIGSFLLCEDGERSLNGSPVGPIDGKGGLVPGTDDREYIGADGIEPEHVGCDRKSLSFAVSRVYSTPALAFAAWVAMVQPPTAANLSAGAVPRVGALTVTDGAAVSTVMQHAALRSLDHVQVGCALALRYTFEGF